MTFVAKWYFLIFKNYKLSFYPLSVPVRSKYNMEYLIHNLATSIFTLSTYIIPDWRPVLIFYFDMNIASLVKKWINHSDQKERKRLILLNRKTTTKVGIIFAENLNIIQSLTEWWFKWICSKWPFWEILSVILLIF